MAHLQPMIGVVNQAIIELENDLDPPNVNKGEELNPPQKVTLHWLWKYVPWHYWVSALGLLVAAFLAGMSFADSSLYKSRIKPLLNKNGQVEQSTAVPTTLKYTAVPTNVQTGRRRI